MRKDFKQIVFYWKTEVFSPKLESLFLENEKDQYSSNLVGLNFIKRKELISYAYNHSNFYRRKYQNHGIEPNSIQTESDFLRIPIVKRDDIKNDFYDFISDNADKKHYYKSTTGGSTGSPISVLHDKRYPLIGVQRRVLNWWGVKPYQNAAFIYRTRFEGFRKTMNDLIWWPTKRIFLDASAMNKSSMMHFAQLFNRVKPKLLQGYVGAVYEFALFVLDNHLKLETPLAVWVTSAPLTQQQRSIMQDAFQAPVYDQYGTCEIMWLAAECREKNGLHIMSDIRHIEFVDENNEPVPPNTWGRILLTDLQNHVFPLIRYEIGDYGRALDFECKCGIKLPLMDNVRGRQSDVIKTPSGIIISGEYLTTIFDSYPESIRQFQLVQSKDYAIQLLYIPNKNKDVKEVISAVLNNLIKKTNNEVQISAKQADRIDHLKGKTRFIISERD